MKVAYLGTMLLALSLGLPTNVIAQEDWVERGLVFGGITIAGLTIEMYALLGAAVAIALKGADTCQRTHCGGQLRDLIERHPFIGKAAAVAAINKFIQDHPTDKAAVVIVMADAGLVSQSTSRLDSNGQPLAHSIPPPPGDCDPGTHRQLQNDVNSSCKGGSVRACLSTDAQEVIAAKALAFRQCALARTKINEVCFRGGDHGQRNAATQAYQGLANCESLAQ